MKGNIFIKIAVFIAIPFIGSAQNAVTDSTIYERESKIVLPKTDYHYNVVHNYIEDRPDADYVHASEEVYEAFRDIKFSIRIHWGVYSMLNVDASWPFLNFSREKQQEYINLYKTFNPVKFNAEEWMAFFKRSGIQAFAFTTKHHDGFSMFHTKTKIQQRTNFLNPDNPIEPCNLHYSIEETPFKRDIVGELCEAAHRNGIKIDLYYSHPDWYDADFRPYNSHPLSTPSILAHPDDYGFGYKNYRRAIKTADRTPEETARMIARHREQLHELLTNYGHIDMICLDQWLGRDVWPETRETVKLMREWSPNTMFRNRGIGNYGDYFQPEQFVPGGAQDTGMPWMSICLLGNQFSYDPDSAHYKGTPWIIHNLIDCVSKGGSFMVCIGPDAQGLFHPEAVRQIEAVGEWLKTNGKGIYETRLNDVWKQDSVYFTRTKDHSKVYAITELWPGTELSLKAVKPLTGSKIYLLGYKKPLLWRQSGDELIITIPKELQKESKRPCKYAWTFEIEVN